MTTITALAFALLPAAFAQIMHSVQVGPNGTLTYDPPFITAAAGDTVRFTFNPKNHTVTQSSFAAPCVPLAGGATSGFQFESSVSTLLDTWELVIANSTTPAYYFCEQTGHCGKGMVFTINAPADPDPQSFSAFQALAEQLNGTGSNASGSSSASSSGTSSAPASSQTHGAAMANKPLGFTLLLSAIGAVAALLSAS